MKAVIYGVGKNFCKYKSEIYSNYEVVALCDSSSAKQGTIVNGLEVLNLSQMTLVVYDRIIVTVTLTDFKIKELLSEFEAFGIDVSKVYFTERGREFIEYFDDLLCEQYSAEEGITGVPGYMTDFQGIKNSLIDLPFIPKDRDGKVVSYRDKEALDFNAGQREYVGLLMAVEEAADMFTMFEFGAGWGPFMSAAAFACKKKGVGKIDVNGVEGERNKIPLMKRHLTVNGLRPETDELFTLYGNVSVKIFNNVVAVTNEIFEFPLVEEEHYGASLLQDFSEWTKDRIMMIEGITPEILFADYMIIDFVHIDIQGYEKILLNDESVLNLFSQKVKYITIGTHSREDEVVLIKNLYNAGFYLLREEGCVMSTKRELPENLVDMTIIDGVQVWRNSKYATNMWEAL